MASSILETPAVSQTLEVSDLFLMRVPISHEVFRRVRRWDDMSQVHRAVMSLFPAELPGPPGERRATSSILYRVDVEPKPHVLIQSRVLPIERQAGDLEIISLLPLRGALSTGAQVGFRLRYNATIRPSRSTKLTPIIDERLALQKLFGDTASDGMIGKGIELASLLDSHHGVLRAKGNPLNTWCFGGIAEVTDPSEAWRLMAEGVGRSRAFGCGLLSVAMA